MVHRPIRSSRARRLVISAAIQVALDEWLVGVPTGPPTASLRLHDRVSPAASPPLPRWREQDSTPAHRCPGKAFADFPAAPRTPCADPPVDRPVDERWTTRAPRRATSRQRRSWARGMSVDCGDRLPTSCGRPQNQAYPSSQMLDVSQRRSTSWPDARSPHSTSTTSRPARYPRAPASPLAVSATACQCARPSSTGWPGRPS